MRWGLVTPLRQATAVGARPGSLVRLLGGAEFVRYAGSLPRYRLSLRPGVRQTKALCTVARDASSSHSRPSPRTTTLRKPDKTIGRRASMQPASIPPPESSVYRASRSTALDSRQLADQIAGSAATHPDGQLESVA